MDREIITRALAQAEDHATQASLHVARQREIIHELTRDGYDARLAKELLATFETSQALHVADAARLRKELDDGSYDFTERPAATAPDAAVPGYDFCDSLATEPASSSTKPKSRES